MKMNITNWKRNAMLLLTLAAVVLGAGTRQAQAQNDLNSFTLTTFASGGITVLQSGPKLTITLIKGTTLSTGETVTSIFGDFLLSDTGTFTAGATPLSTVSEPTGYKFVTNSTNVVGFTNDSKSNPILPGKSLLFTFGNDLTGLAATNPYGFHISTSLNNVTTTFHIRLNGASPAPAVPEPGSVATMVIGGLGLMGMVLSARKRRRANDMI